MRALRPSRFDREILALAIPALGALAADPLVSLVDTAFVGRLGTVPLASLGVAVAVFGIAFALANFLPYGATPLVAAAVGAGDDREAGRLGRGAFVVALMTGALALVVLEVAAEPLARLLGAAPTVLGGTLTYLRIRALSLPAVFLVLVGHGVFRGHQDTRTPLLASLLISGINLILDPILIYGFDLDLAGAAWATVIAQWSGAVVFIALAFGPHRTRLKLDAGRDVRLRSLFNAGGSLIIRTAVLVGVFSAATAVAARIGTRSLAAHHVAFQVWLFLALVVDSLAIAAHARVGAYIGAGDVRTAREVSNRLLGMGLLLGIGLTVVLGAGAGVLPGWFTDDAAVVTAVGSIYPFVVLTQPLNALVFVWDGVGIGAGAFPYLARSTVVAGAISIGALAAVATFDLGLTAVWWSLSLFMVSRWAALGWWYEIGPLARRRGPASRAA